MGGFLRRLSRRLLAIGGLALMLIAPALARAAPSAIWLPACAQPGQALNFDLSTTSSAYVDPYWTVTAANTTAPFLPADRMTPAQIPLAWAPLANWIQPASLPVTGSLSGDDYTYQVQFNVPKCDGGGLSLSGTYWADNAVLTISLTDGLGAVHPLTPCNAAFPNFANCFSTGYQTAFGPAPVTPGLNTLTVVVHNGASATGLAVNAAVTGHCQGACKAGLVKVCKAAGASVPPGLPFGFTAGSSLLVPAGPAPGGICLLGPSLAVGTVVTVTEQIPAGFLVSAIAVAPPARQFGSPNPAGGVASVTIGPGVTEVTFTDTKNSGWLQVCKQGRVGGNYGFTVSPGAVYPATAQPIVIASHQCSPAFEVPAGPVVITETSHPPFVLMVGCSTVPASAQGPCNPLYSGQTSTVTVAPGGPLNPTIATITDSKNATARPPGKTR